jgi:hypothetical protein
MNHENPGLTIVGGTCCLTYAVDIGLAVDLEAAESLLREAKQRHRFEHRRKAPSYFRFDPPPVHVSLATPPLDIAGRDLAGTVDTVIFDFGAVSVTFRLPLDGPLDDLLAVSEAIYDNPALLDRARGAVDTLLAAIRPAVTRPERSEAIEDYFVFHLEKFALPFAAEEFLERHRGLVARILRAESTPLSEQEIADALDCRLSFGREDLTIIDWNAAVVVDEQGEDTRAVLEYANVELLEMRTLDDRLDTALDQTYAILKNRGRLRHIWPGSSYSDLGRIAEMQMDSALLFEGVNNALKLLGDHYLARVYRLAAKRLHLAEWDTSILRKLSSLESTYEKLSGLAGHRRAEFLEWLIIILIGVSIALELLMLIKE